MDVICICSFSGGVSPPTTITTVAESADAATTAPRITPKVAVMGDGGVAPNVREFTAKKKVVHQLQMEVGSSKRS